MKKDIVTRMVTQKFILRFCSDDIGKSFVFIHPFTGNRHTLEIIDCVQIKLPKKIGDVCFKPNSYAEQIFYKITPAIDGYYYFIDPTESVNPSDCILSIGGDNCCAVGVQVSIDSKKKYDKDVKSVSVNKPNCDCKVVWKLYITN